MDWVIHHNTPGERPVTREDVKASIQREGKNADAGLKQMDFVVQRVLDQRAADKAAADEGPVLA